METEENLIFSNLLLHPKPSPINNNAELNSLRIKPN